MSDLGPCRGERRRCGRPASVVRQGRALCESPVEIGYSGTWAEALRAMATGARW